MIVRVALAVTNTALQAYLERKFSASDVRVEALWGQRSVWQKVMRCGCDVIVISETAIPEEVEDGIGMLNSRPTERAEIGTVRPDMRSGAIMR